ncbi:MAG: sn-glycerol-1-phosphate dehydrogenase [Treponema sp.]|jgi:glycerol-1-phosphate dehydrogenase [NAD(P)+]|nr:sn-glycerol-1-phosphate dehydrogenase [Treponema sp.]
MDAYSKNSIPSLTDCLKAADETKELLISRGCYAEIPSLLRGLYRGSGVYLISDENTWEAAGRGLKEILDGAGIPIRGEFRFPAEPRLHAEYTHITLIKEKLSALPNLEETVPIAIGGGTVNDLVKRAASELGRTYLCVPTAASVDGYTAYGAAILYDGYKQTMSCPAPLALAAEPEVLARAPAYLSSSGFGDLASKIIAGCDWILCDVVGPLGAPAAEPINQKVWNMTQPGLLDYLERSIDAPRGDGDAVAALFEALAITGFSMQAFKGSRPVSGSEHLFSHVWEMDDLSLDGVPVTHGHKVSIGTLAATACYEIFFADPAAPPSPPKGYVRPSPSQRMVTVSSAFRGSRSHDLVVKTALEKYMDDAVVERIHEALRDNYKELRDRLLARLLPYGKLREMLGKAQCPLKPESIGLSRSQAIATARRAQMMRNKYCLLDLSWDLGVMETILSRMEDSEQYLR